MSLLTALLSLLTACAPKPKPAPEPAPTKPGVSLPLNYPVALVDERDIRVKDDESTLITTSVASGGVYYPSYRFIDSQGIEYSVVNVTSFGRKSAIFDMGTSRFQVFLQLKSKGSIPLAKAKTLMLASVLKPEEETIDPQRKQFATDRFQNATSFPDLIEIARDPWKQR